MSDTDQHDRVEPSQSGQSGGPVPAAPFDDAEAWDDGSGDDGLADDGWGDDEEELYVTLPEEGGWVRKVAFVLVAMVLVVGVLFGGAWLWLQRQLDPEGEPGAPVAIEVPEGATASQVARILEEEGVVSSATIFRLYAEWKEAGQFQAGKYEGLRENESMEDALAILEEGPLPPVFREFTVPEGLWLSDVAPVILQAFPEMDPAELQAAIAGARGKYQPPDQPNAEGMLFPSTYQVGEDDITDEVAVVKMMTDQMDATVDELGYADSMNRVGYDPYQVMVIASLVEEEAKTEGDRAKIARVIYNRLAAGMKLEIDATVPYALGQHKEELTKTDLNVDSPYNTRRYKGIPPTPIAAPGRASLEAALNPAEGPWIYYVLADAEGNHFFTDNYNEFLAAKNDAQAAGLF